MRRLRVHARLLLVATLVLSLPGFGADLRGEAPLPSWQFQPGKAVDVEPVPEDWLPVQMPYVWTSWQHVRDGAGKAWATRDLHKVNSGWFETSAGVPADWQGRRVYLDLAGVECDAVVWVNGQRLGEVKGPDGRVEITGAAPPGKTAAVRLWVTRWWEGTTNQRVQDVLRDLTLKGRAKTEWYANDEEVRVAVPAGISEGATVRAVPAEAEVENVFVQTSFRRKELAAQVKCALQTNVAGARLRVQVTELDGRTDGLPKTEVPATGDAPQQTVVLPWADPHRWEVGAAYLYLLRVSLVNADGGVLDEYPPVRFGFREIWTDGKELILNGHPLRLRLAYFVRSVPQMILFEGMGFNAMEMQPNPSAWYGTWGLFPPAGSMQSGGTLLDAADERGWAVLMPAPGVTEVRDELLKPEAQKLYSADFQTWLRKADRQNRPSILMWTPSMNTGGTYEPTKIGRKPDAPQQPWYGRVEEPIKSQDPTRLVFHHSGGQTGDMQTLNCYLNFVPLQEREEYLSAWSESGETPWAAVEHGPPTSVNFFKRATVPYFTEYAAMYLGDEAYALEKDEYVEASITTAAKASRKSAFSGVSAFAAAGHLDHIGEWTGYDRFMDLFIRNTNRAWRGWGMNGGWFPWLFDIGFGNPPGEKRSRQGWRLYESLAEPDEKLKERPDWASPLYDAYHDTMQPLLVFLGGPAQQFTRKDHSFSAGDTVEKSIVAVWDGATKKSPSVHWKLVLGAKVAAQGDDKVALSPGDLRRDPLKFTAPVVTQRTSGLLELEARDEAGAVVVRDQLALTFFPRSPKGQPVARRWGVFDPVGKTAAQLTRLGLKYRRVTSAADLADTDVLVIGYKALSRTRALPFGPADIDKGLRVLFFEQDADSLEAMGFRVQDVVPRYVFPRVRQHPLLAGLEPADLINWRGEGNLVPATSEGRKLWPWPHGPHWGNTGSVASVVAETPHRGAFTPVVECEFDLAYSPLLLWQHGRGEVVFCQLDITDRDELEPAAGRVLRNLLRYLDVEPAAAQNKRVLAVGDSATAFISELGVQTQRTDSGDLPAALPSDQVVVLGPDSLGSAAPVLPKLRQFVAAGGSVLVLPQHTARWEAAGAPFRCTVEPAKLARVNPQALGDQSDLLRGIGPELLHWRTFVEMTRFAEQGLPQNGRRLLDGLLLDVPEGKGRWVCSQVDWRPLADDSDNLRRARWNARRFYRHLLTNLGARTDAATAEQMLGPRQYAPMVNVSLWQVLNQLPAIAPDTGPNNSLLALSAPLAVEQWVASPVAEKRRDFDWRLRGTDKNGYLDFTYLGAPKVGQVGYAVTHVYSSVAREANLALSSDWWFVFKVDGTTYVDQGKDGRVPHAPAPGEVRVRLPLRKGWNRLEVKVGSGGAGFGFWCQVSDPGDLRLAPTVTLPDSLPAAAPAAASLLKEPLSAGRELLYVEPLLKEDDPYGFTPW